MASVKLTLRGRYVQEMVVECYSHGLIESPVDPDRLRTVTARLLELVSPQHLEKKKISHMVVALAHLALQWCDRQVPIAGLLDLFAKTVAQRLSGKRRGSVEPRSKSEILSIQAVAVSIRKRLEAGQHQGAHNCPAKIRAMLHQYCRLMQLEPETFLAQAEPLLGLGMHEQLYSRGTAGIAAAILLQCHKRQDIPVTLSSLSSIFCTSHSTISRTHEVLCSLIQPGTAPET